MSQASLIYDEINNMLALLFPTKKQLSDGFILENNAELELENAYGLYFGPALNTKRLVGCQFSAQRQIQITITQAVRGGHKSLDITKGVEKDIFEDHYLLIKEFAKNQNLNSLSVKRDFVSDNGIERIFGEQKNFLMIQSLFEIEYFENLN
jgi:hypothetical protein